MKKKMRKTFENLNIFINGSILTLTRYHNKSLVLNQLKELLTILIHCKLTLKIENKSIFK